MGSSWTAEEVAEYLGVAVVSVYRFRGEGDLPAPLDEDERPLRWDPEVVRKWADEWFKHRQEPPDVTDVPWWGYREIADYLGISPVSAQRYKSKGDLPEPGRYYGRSPVWKPEVIIEWARSRPSGKWKDRSSRHRGTAEADDAGSGEQGT